MRKNRQAALVSWLVGAFVLLGAVHASAQAVSPSVEDEGSAPAAIAAAVVNAETPPADYVIGPGDVLSVLFWREENLSSDVVVRPDGRITIPLINEIHVTGMTPDQLRDEVTREARRYVQDPSVTVVVKEINSRVVYITGEVAAPGPYPLIGPTTVLQLISMAGGLRDFANKGKIVIMRNLDGEPQNFRFNYNWVLEGKNIKQNIHLMPGDTVVVP